jgi:hypothetical protein
VALSGLAVIDDKESVPREALRIIAVQVSGVTIEWLDGYLSTNGKELVSGRRISMERVPGFQS